MTADINDTDLQEVYRTFISGCHILHHHDVLDAYGHLSVRHPHKSDIFIMSRSIAPATVSSPDDLIEYYISTAEPVDPSSAKGYAERCIHSECYKLYPNIRSIVHSHSEAVVPYTVSGVPMRPCYHMAGFLGAAVPVFDVKNVYQEDNKRDMLISNTRLGNALALSFSGRGDGETLDHSVVLMRGHGFTVVGESIQDAVLRAIFTQSNARIQTTALTTAAATYGTGNFHIKYLEDEELEDTEDVTRWSVSRPWGLWVKEVEAAGLYVNKA